MTDQQRAGLLAEYGSLAAKVAKGDDGEAVMNKLKEIETKLGMTKEQIVTELLAKL